MERFLSIIAAIRGKYVGVQECLDGAQESIDSAKAMILKLQGENAQMTQALEDLARDLGVTVPDVGGGPSGEPE